MNKELPKYDSIWRRDEDGNLIDTKKETKNSSNHEVAEKPKDDEKPNASEEDGLPVLNKLKKRSK